MYPGFWDEYEERRWPDEPVTPPAPPIVVSLSPQQYALLCTELRVAVNGYVNAADCRSARKLRRILKRIENAAPTAKETT